MRDPYTVYLRIVFKHKLPNKGKVSLKIKRSHRGPDEVVDVISVDGMYAWMKDRYWAEVRSWLNDNSYPWTERGWRDRKSDKA